MGKINFNELDDYLNDEADYEVRQKIKSKVKKPSIYKNDTDQELES